MRKDYQGSTFGDISMEYRLKKAKRSFLLEVDKIIDFTKIERKLKKKYNPKARIDGAPAYPSLLMFKILLLQQWFNLSDYEAEEQLIVRLDFMKFVGLSMDSEVPDHSTISRFRNKLLELNLYDKFLLEINKQLEKLGLLVKKGAVVDATVVESSRRPRKVIDTESIPEDRKEESNEKVEDSNNNCQVSYSSDEEAKWLKKGKNYYYGYKAHISVDSEHGFILGGHATPANVSDTVEFESLVEESSLDSGSIVFADKGYASKSNREYLDCNDYIDGIMIKNKKHQRITELDKKINKLISKVRYKVERTIGTLKRDYGFSRSRYLGRMKLEMEFKLKAMAFNIKKAVLMVAI